MNIPIRLADVEPYEVGQLLYVTSGEYSNYGVVSVAKVLKAFVVADFLKTIHGRYVIGQTPLGHYTEVRLDYQRLVTEGYVKEMPARELWCHE